MTVSISRQGLLVFLFKTSNEVAKARLTRLALACRSSGKAFAETVPGSTNTGSIDGVARSSDPAMRNVTSRDAAIVTVWWRRKIAGGPTCNPV